MGDLIIPKGIAGKYFINAIAAANGMQALIRGRVVGPVATELSPFYLCDIYPVDDSEIGVTTQTIVGLEQLVGVYFYEDRTLMNAAWVQMNTVLLARQKKIEAERRRKVSSIQEMIGTGGSGTVDVDGTEDAAELIVEALTTKPAAPPRPRAKRQQKGTGAAE